MAKNLSRSTHLLPPEVKTRGHCLLVPTLRTVSKHPFYGLFSAVGCFLLFLHFFVHSVGDFSV